jgi:CRP-like cAMP-binding protein
MREETRPVMAALLGRLPHDEYQRLLPTLERVTLSAQQVLYGPGAPITHVYFPIDCVVSLLTVLGADMAVGTAVVGREGVAGVPVVLGPLAGRQQARCEIAGDAWRLPVGVFVTATEDGGRLPALVRRYTQALLLATAQRIACARWHPTTAQCAQWLLMCGDRTGTDRLPLSHATLAQLLGVRRATVTVALGLLQRAGLLAYRRARIDLLDRPGLEAAACDCYGLLRTTFAHVVEAAPSLR